MSNRDGRRAHDWIAPLVPAIAAVSSADLAVLERFEGDLTGLLAAYPVDAGVEPVLRSQRLQKIRAATAASGYLALAVPSGHGGSGRPAVVQALMQFVCGYYDVDLRDSTGLGHGRLIADHASAPVRDLWVRGFSMARCPASLSPSRTVAARSTRPGPARHWHLTERER